MDATISLNRDPSELQAMDSHYQQSKQIRSSQDNYRHQSVSPWSSVASYTTL